LPTGIVSAIAAQTRMRFCVSSAAPAMPELFRCRSRRDALWAAGNSFSRSKNTPRAHTGLVATVAKSRRNGPRAMSFPGKSNSASMFACDGFRAPKRLHHSLPAGCGAGGDPRRECEMGNQPEAPAVACSAALTPFWSAPAIRHQPEIILMASGAGP